MISALEPSVIGQLVGFVCEIISVDVISVSVVVVVGAVVAVVFFLIDPHGGRQIFMVVFDALVKHRHNHTRVACRELPCILDSDIGSFHSSF